MIIFLSKDRPPAEGLDNKGKGFLVKHRLLDAAAR